jgi:hypothetical protein
VAEVPASEDASASCYDFPKNIRVFAMIVTELKLRQVEREIFGRDVVISADDATLQ